MGFVYVYMMLLSRAAEKEPDEPFQSTGLRKQKQEQ